MEWGKCRTARPCSSPEKENQNSNWSKSRKAWSNALFTIRLNSHIQTKSLNQTHRIPLSEAPQLPAAKTLEFALTDLVSDRTSLLSDEILLEVLSSLPISQRNSNYLVSRRWLNLQGRLVKSVKVFDWEFLVTGRLFSRFPNLIGVDLVSACLISPQNSGIFCTNGGLCFHVGSDVSVDDEKWLFDGNFVMDSDEIDAGLRVLAAGCPNMRKLVVINSSEMGVLSVAEACLSLQELDLLMCNDRVLRGIAACRNLQVLRLTGVVNGFYESLVTDVGLTILAQGCKRLSKLELNGCQGSYEGIKAIGQCCQVLEELTLCNHKMEGGWLLALPFCEGLKSLRLVSCRRIDGSDELDEDEGNMGSCPVVDRLHLEKCQLRDKRDLRALFLVCRNVGEAVILNCWGLNDDAFGASRVLRKVRSLSLEGCSTLTTHGLESVIISWEELRSLKVKSCNNIKDCEINPALSVVFSSLKDLQWQPDTKSLLAANLEGAGMRKRGSKFFSKSCDWKSAVPGA